MDSHGCSLTAVVTHGSTWKHPEMAPLLRVIPGMRLPVSDMCAFRLCAIMDKRRSQHFYSASKFAYDLISDAVCA